MAVYTTDVADAVGIPGARGGGSLEHPVWPSVDGKHGAAGRSGDLGCAVCGATGLPLKACDGCKGPRRYCGKACQVKVSGHARFASRAPPAPPCARACLPADLRPLLTRLPSYLLLLPCFPMPSPEEGHALLPALLLALVQHGSLCRLNLCHVLVTRGVCCLSAAP